MTRLKTFLFSMLLLIIAAGRVAAVIPDKQMVVLIKSAVFEVVALKPVEDYIKYEKPLPLDLIPYSIRNDKYLPIGTAFAINESTLATAAHVFSLFLKSQYQPLTIRDNNGRIYQIDKIVGYSTWRDVMCFTLKDKKFTRFFPVNLKPAFNEPVFAVGNALGEGIVIRDGLLVSETYEEEEGKWKWLRFSAAASPGNSGGPLIDKKGRVIGVITMKSENENLNYALPMTEAARQMAGPASLHIKSGYTLPNCTFRKLMTEDMSFTLPCGYDSLQKQLQASYRKMVESHYYALLQEHHDQIFPFGDGSINLRYKNSSKTYPSLIGQDKDGSWDAYVPSSIKNADLGDNGSLQYGEIYGYLMMHLRSPDSLTVAGIFGNSERLMDLLLKGLPFDRNIANTSTEITSLGPAAMKYVYRDSYGRPWQVMTWNISYSDECVALFSLPTPDGALCLMRVIDTNTLESGLDLDMKFLANMLFFSYYGTVKDWRVFLSHPEFLPEGFRFSLSDRTGATGKFQADWMTVDFKGAPYAMVDSSDIRLRFGYSAAGDKAVWALRGATMGQSKYNTNFYGITSFEKPIPKAGDDYRAGWKKKISGEHPYNQTSYYEDQSTYIAKIIIPKGSPANDPQFVYSITCGQEGKIPEKEMQRLLDKTNKAITIEQP